MRDELENDAPAATAEAPQAAPAADTPATVATEEGLDAFDGTEAERAAHGAGYVEGMLRGAAAERDRVREILASPAAKSKPKLAMHFALDSDLDVASAIAALGVDEDKPAARGLGPTMPANPNLRSDNGDRDRKPAAANVVGITSTSIYNKRRATAEAAAKQPTSR